METARQADAPAGEAGVLRWRLESLRSRLRTHRSWHVAALILFATVLFSATANQPLHLDNMDFPAVAKQTSVSGIPVYYRGEDSQKHLGLYHPPLYIYSLAAWIRVFGFGPVQVRMFGFICALLQGAIVLAIFRTLLGRTAAWRIAPWFWAVFLLSPYTLQAASIADIDTTIYGPLLCGIVLYALRLSWRDGKWRTDNIAAWEYVCISLLIVLALWAKLTTILLFVLVLPPLLRRRFGWARALSLSAMLVGSAAVVFLASYWAYGQITGLDFTYSIRFTIDSFLRRGSSGHPGVMNRLFDRYSTFRRMVPVHLLWTGLFPWVVGLAVFFVAGWRAARRKTALDGHIATIIGLALLTTAYYCAQTMMFGAAPFKYTFVCWGLVCVGPALLALLLFEDPDLMRKTAGVWGGLALVIAVLVGSRALHDDLIREVRTPLAIAIWRTPAVIALVILAVSIRWRTAARAGMAVALGAYVGLNLGVALHQARVPYSTTYDYGQLGFSDTVGFIRAETPPDGLIVSMKDIGFAADRRYIENYGAIWGGADSEQHLKRGIASGEVEFAVFTEGHGQDQLIVKPSLKAWVDANTILVRSFGNYRVYRPLARMVPLARAVGAVR